MTQKEIGELKKENRTILLETTQFVNINHPDLPSILTITWRHNTRELMIFPKGIIKNEPVKSGCYDLATKNILILNHEHVGHERVYKIEVDKESKKVKLLELHDKGIFRRNIKIKDKQL